MFPMIVGQKSLPVSLLASVTTTAKMLDFCDRHQIVQVFDMKDINDAFKQVEQAPPLRVVLKQ